MTRDLSKFTQRTFDLLVVGGGIMGAGIAWDAAHRGLSCALAEQGDFASGTSSKTTKLIHGGIRYLENFDFALVRQSIRERKTLLSLAPDLVHPLPFIIPVKGNSPRPWPMIRLGMALYDFLAGSARIQRSAFLQKEQISEEEPLLAQAGVQRAALYYDAQMDDARLVLEVLQAAAQAGAVAANYVQVKRWKTEAGRITGAKLEDRLTGKIFSVTARVVLNATGPWADRLRHLADPSLRPIVRPSKGIHLIYPDMGLKHALLLSSPQDGRIFFLIPWKNMTLIGTTDTDCNDDPAEVRAEESEVDYLIKGVNRLLPQLRLERAGIIAAFAGVRPLVAQEKKDPWAVSRSHLIHEDPNGLVSVVGGKFTTFRATAQEVVDDLSRRFPEKRLKPCTTGQSPFSQQVLRAETMKRWISTDPRMADLLCPHHPFIKADVRYAVEREMAMNLGDILWRRLGIGWSACRGLDALQATAEVAGNCLGWGPAEIQRQMERYRSEVVMNRLQK